MADLGTAWTVVADWLTKSVPGLILLGLVPNLIILAVRRAGPGVAREWRRAKVDSQKWVEARDYYLQRSEPALIVACAAHVSRVAWWVGFGTSAGLIAILATGDHVPRAILSFFSFYGLMRATQHGKMLGVMYKRHVEDPVKAILKQMAADEAAEKARAGETSGSGAPVPSP